MRGFVSRLAELNALADGSDGGRGAVVGSARERLTSLDEFGPTPFAFTFKVSFPADAAV
jgi:hypothetical protein